MRKFFGIIIIFFALAFSLLLNSNANQVQAIQTSDTIQVKKEIVELISNSFLDSKTSSYKEKNSKKYLNLTPFALSYHQTNCLQGADRVQYSGSFIQNRTTEKQKNHQIRAP